MFIMFSYSPRPAGESSRMQRALARTLLLVLGVSFAPLLMAQLAAHDCCAPKAQEHCPSHERQHSISAAPCSWSHHCCTWLASRQAARPSAATHMAVEAAARPAVAPITRQHFARLLIEDYPGRSPPRHS
jgi:hypothetical protein